MCVCLCVCAFKKSAALHLETGCYWGSEMKKDSFFTITQMLRMSCTLQFIDLYIMGYMRICLICVKLLI